MQHPFLIQKEDQRLPDAYSISVFYHGEAKATEYEVVEHRIIDKVYQGREVERTKEDGTVEKVVAFDLVGVSPVPHIEYTTVKGHYGIIPLSSFKELNFDDRWSKIVAIGKEKGTKK